MNNILWCFLAVLLISSRRITALNTRISVIEAEQAVLRSMFTTKVDRLNNVTGRHEYAETLREELERIERDTGVK